MAAMKGHYEVVVTLMSHEAFVNVQSKSGYTPLMLASIKDHGDVVRVLLSNGAYDIPNMNGQTALQIAKEKEHLDIVQLIEYQQRSLS
jgi:ankyrin repeat protein